ncbi:MAG TPA: polysaccharide deacetylase family protein [Planctomycetota bacterium]|nr:polysaccharide deacetylase family protein [Planctomycetota bacterium]
MKTPTWACILGLVLGPASQEREIRLLVRADDLGAAHAINEASIKACKEGIARSVEILVPGSWFLEAVRLLKENPEIDVGVHLCLTSEWENVKWRPLTGPSSLTDKDGYFFPMVRQRKDFPPGTGLLEANPKPEDVERELRAQIEKVREHLPRVSHVSTHMGAAVATPEMRAITQKLAQEYRLIAESPGTRGLGWGARKFDQPETQKETALVEILSGLQPGTWMFVEHCGQDGPEMRAMGHTGYSNVAQDREGVTRAFTSAKVKAVLAERGIRLVSYADLRKD